MPWRITSPKRTSRRHEIWIRNFFPESMDNTLSLAWFNRQEKVWSLRVGLLEEHDSWNRLSPKPDFPGVSEWELSWIFKQWQWWQWKPHLTIAIAYYLLLHFFWYTAKFQEMRDYTSIVNMKESVLPYGVTRGMGKTYTFLHFCDCYLYRKFQLKCNRTYSINATQRLREIPF